MLFVNRYFHPDLSATSQMLTDLAVDLAARGWDVGVVSSRQRYEDAQASLPAADEHGGVQIRRVWTAAFGRKHLLGRALDYLSFYVTSAWRLRRWARAGDVVVLKTDPPMLSVLGWMLFPRGGVQRVHWLQDLFPEVASELGVPGSGGWLGRMLRALRNRSLLGGWNVAIGEVMAARLRESVADASLRLYTIPNWADGEAIRPVPSGDRRLREAWGLEDAFVIGYSGNLGRAHEFETVLEAAAELDRKSLAESQAAAGLPRVLFLFIGGGKGVDDLRAAVSARGLSNVRFEPYQSRVALNESLQVPDLHWVSLRPELEGCIVPSKFYGILAAGRPTIFIGDEQGELARVIEASGCGAVVSMGDAAALIGIIEGMRGSADEVAAMGARARRLFDERYAREYAVDAWEQLLLRVVDTD